MNKILPSIFFILAFVFIFPGCNIKQTLSFNKFSKDGLPSPHIFLEETDRNDHRKNTLKAIAHVEVNTSEGRYPLKVAVMLKRPSSLRLEVIPFIGSPNLLLTVHDNLLKVFLPQKGEFYIGQATTKNLRCFLPILTEGLQVEDIISILFGTHSNIIGKSITLNGSSEDDLYRIDVLSENRKKQSIWIDMEYHMVMVESFTRNDSMLFSARYTEHNSMGGVTMPQKITIVGGDDDNRNIIIRYSDMEVATGVDAAQFDLQPPHGIKPIYLD
jgi:outer membrane lipoprotein-sorting protein